MINTFVVYFSMLAFMLISFRIVCKLSPYNNNGMKSWGYYISFVFPLLIYAFVMGVRYDVGVDYLGYLDAYLYGYRFRQKEILYMVINNSFALCGLPYPYFFGFIAFLQICLFCCAFRKEPWLLGWLVFFLLFSGEFQSWNNIIRVSISASVFAFSIDYLENKKILYLAICAFVVIGFHTSSMVVLLIYILFFNGKNFFKSITIQYVLLAFSLAIRTVFFQFSSFLGSVMDIYYTFTGGYETYTIEAVTNQKAELGTGLGFIVVLVINIIVIAYSSKLHTFYNSKKFNIIYNLFFIGVISKYMIPGGFIVLHRPFVLFNAMIPVIYAYFAYYLYFKRKQSVNQFVLWTTCVLFIGMYVGNIIRLDKYSHVWYQTYREHPEVTMTPIYKPKSVFVN